MSNSSNSPRLGLGLSEERKAALQQANRLKQELYAQQKKIQFSNLLERANGDVDAYLESQDNVFISSGRSVASNNEESSSLTNSDASEQYREVESDDQDGFDFFYRGSYSSSVRPRRTTSAVPQEEIIFDPEDSSSKSLRDHLLEQLQLDGKYASLSPEIKILCREIVDKLDSSGYFKLDDVSSQSSLPPNAIAYPDYDEEHEQIIAEFDAMFDMNSTYEDRVRMKNALKDYFDPESVSKFSRRLAREEFDSVVGRKTSKEERERARDLLANLDFQTYSNDPFAVLFNRTPTPKEKQQAEEALAIVQSLDPPGVGARDLRESLLLRLPNDAPHAHELRIMISEHFDDFLKKRIGVLAGKTGVSASIISEIYASPFPFLPAPEQIFAKEETQSTRWIQPEVVVERAENGRWIVRLDESQEDVELNPEYRKMLLAKRIDKKTKDYLRRQLVEAQALLDALRNRNSTILRVAKAIVDFQEDFFSTPTSSPKPLTQQQIADKLGLDSSTISRACNDKWMSTPRGFVAFKTFFPKAVSGDVTSMDVAEAIKQIIAQEDKAKPLSDEEITATLKKQFAISVSRKTVQEHRDRLQIPNSRSRKKRSVQK